MRDFEGKAAIDRHAGGVRITLTAKDGSTEAWFRMDNDHAIAFAKGIEQAAKANKRSSSLKSWRGSFSGVDNVVPEEVE